MKVVWPSRLNTICRKPRSTKPVSYLHRYYQPKELAGGVRLVGGGDNAAGVFGMDFSQPPYRWETGAFQANINFAFKKSVFFADFVIICLGSGVTSSNSSPYITQVCNTCFSLHQDSSTSHQVFFIKDMCVHVQNFKRGL